MASAARRKIRRAGRTVRVPAPVTITAGRAFAFTVTAQDSFNNTVPTYAGTVTVISSDNQAVLPAGQQGLSERIDGVTASLGDTWTKIAELRTPVHPP